MLVRIESLVKGYNGTSANVKFDRGVAEKEITEEQLKWFEAKGYIVSEISETTEDNTNNNPEDLDNDAFKKEEGINETENLEEDKNIEEKLNENENTEISSDMKNLEEIE